ncbi:MAG TPA: DUF805 domain-containing protein [Xanthomonadaceae bacterium]|nr:DUF805 domain-containing protein [Xanthomonadaceae bacterium]
MEWMLMPLKRYADFSGRSRRKEYWMFALLQLVIYGVLGVFLGIGAAMSRQDSPGALLILAVVLMVLVALALVVPSIAVAVRRFHDQDKSGWFYLLALIPYVGGLIVLIFMFFEGTQGPNQYGPDPKQA